MEITFGNQSSQFANGHAFNRPHLTLLARWHLLGLKAGIAYCLVSILTLPMVIKVWFGEVPVLAVIQMPKLLIASWMRQHIVMEAIKSLGLSKGSFSPDFIMARPFGLGLAYSVPIILVSLSLLIPACATRIHRQWALIFFVTLMVDYVFTYIFAARRSLTLY
jgi:hypothetical protein